MDSSSQAKPEQKSLTPKQRLFIDAYVGEACFNATRAAILAGYSEKSAAKIGHDLKKTPYIRARIDEILDANTITTTELLRELSDVGMRGLHEFIEITRYDKDGNPVAARMDAGAKLKALELLGKSRSLFVERQDVTVGGSLTREYVIVTEDPA